MTLAEWEQMRAIPGCGAQEKCPSWSDPRAHKHDTALPWADTCGPCADKLRVTIAGRASAALWELYVGMGKPELVLNGRTAEQAVVHLALEAWHDH